MLWAGACDFMKCHTRPPAARGSVNLYVLPRAQQKGVVGMLARTLLSFTLLLTLAPLCRAQTAAKTPAPEQAAPEQAAADEFDARRESLLADLRALEAESKELLKPLDAASARAEIGAAAWSLDREWAKSLLREALTLTFPEEVDRARQRERPIGAELQFGPAENGARGRVRRRIYDVAARDHAFARELG